MLHDNRFRGVVAVALLFSQKCKNSLAPDRRSCPAEELCTQPVAPVACQAISSNLVYISQFREFEPRRVLSRINSLGLFLVHKLTCGKRESVS